MRYLLVLLLGVMVATAAGGAEPRGSGPPPPQGPDPAPSFAYLEPVRRDGGVGYVIRFSGPRRADRVTVRVRELPREGKVAILYASRAGERTPVRPQAREGMLPGPAPDGRPWPLFFAEPPPPGGGERDFQVDLQVDSTITTQRLTLSPDGELWRTTSKRVKLFGRRGRLALPDTFREAQDQEAAVAKPRGEKPAPALQAAPAPADAEGLTVGRPAIIAVAGLAIAGLALALYWARRERGRERPSPEQRGMEGRGLLVMLILVLVTTGVMLLRHFAER